MTGHFTSYENRTDHELATNSPGIIAKIHGLCNLQNADAGWNTDHVWEADARTARNTAVRWVVLSMPDTTRTAASASLTSIIGVGVLEQS
jgi:hypothetical protein